MARRRLRSTLYRTRIGPPAGDDLPTNGVVDRDGAYLVDREGSYIVARS